MQNKNTPAEGKDSAQTKDESALRGAACSQSSIIQMGLDMLREEARVNDARLSMAIDHEKQLRKLHESASDALIMLRAVKRDIDARAESILSANKELQHPWQETDLSGDRIPAATGDHANA